MRHRALLLLVAMHLPACRNVPLAPTGRTAGPIDDGTLRAYGAAAGRLVGAAVTTAHLADADYASLAGREFDYLTPENEMKWDSTEPARGMFAFAEGDRLVDFAAQHGMRVKGHNLVWHMQLPAWMTALTDPADVRMAMRAHIAGLAGHYRGKVAAWDVVNEVIDDFSGALRDDVFHRALGEGYVAEAFRAAHEADPGALLFYNEYGIEAPGPKADAAYALVQRLVAAGVPISGVGFQMHVGSIGTTSGADFAAVMKRFAALGLVVNISEMDVRVCDLAGDAAAKLDEQKASYRAIVGACAAEPACVSVTLWGVTDRYSWLNTWFPCSDVTAVAPRGLAFDDDGARKPAWYGIADALREAVPR
jgi:endo-1,4-beta-xylanase